ncbi:MAG TPA: class I SAM-dependent methyltransferase [Verrucomicrobiae bacterium]|nr:class I SAM-dependent methyltransferase [Verrucomicrobiae bacterium]
MLTHEQSLYVGAPRSSGYRRTVEVVTGKLKTHGKFTGKRMLDIGCGEGSFTVVLGQNFEEVHGIDVQDAFLNSFRQKVSADKRFFVQCMSASEMTFPDAHFDTIVSIETLEHVPDLKGAARQISRVLKPGGELLITVPNRWFPFENHGIRVGSWEKHGRIPLLTYFPWLHRRYAIARVFTVTDLDSLFVSSGLRRTATDYTWPTFEHGGNRFQRFLKPLFGVMRTMEHSPLRMFGSSVIVKYAREEADPR